MEVAKNGGLQIARDPKAGKSGGRGLELRSLLKIRASFPAYFFLDFLSKIVSVILVLAVGERFERG
jgi:hypothetical protein